MHIVTLSGSIRTASLNRALLIELGRIIPAPHQVQMLEIADLPHYSEDHDAPAPAVVTAPAATAPRTSQ
jgi:NAD(P)H-dependent FMN reductase